MATESSRQRPEAVGDGLRREEERKLAGKRLTPLGYVSGCEGCRRADIEDAAGDDTGVDVRYGTARLTSSGRSHGEGSGWLSSSGAPDRRGCRHRRRAAPSVLVVVGQTTLTVIPSLATSSAMDFASR